MRLIQRREKKGGEDEKIETVGYRRQIKGVIKKTMAFLLERYEGKVSCREG